MKNKAVFLDRDNTLIEDKGFVHNISDINWLSGAKRGIEYFSRRGFKLIVITNQSGVAKGYFGEDEINYFHDHMNNELVTQNEISIDKFYYCPHHPDGKITKYTKKCNCRKPGDDLFKRAINEMSINPVHSIAIGDRPSDLIPAFNNGVKRGYLVDKQGNHSDFLKSILFDVQVDIIKNWENILDTI